MASTGMTPFESPAKGTPSSGGYGCSGPGTRIPLLWTRIPRLLFQGYPSIMAVNSGESDDILYVRLTCSVCGARLGSFQFWPGFGWEAQPEDDPIQWLKAATGDDRIVREGRGFGRKNVFGGPGPRTQATTPVATVDRGEMKLEWSCSGGPPKPHSLQRRWSKLARMIREQAQAGAITIEIRI